VQTPALQASVACVRRKIIFVRRVRTAHSRPGIHATPENSWTDSCDTAEMNQSPAPIDLTRLSTRYAVSVAVLDDLYARRRAGAHDAELIDLLTQRDRGGLDRERARALVAELPAR